MGKLYKLPGSGRTRARARKLLSTRRVNENYWIVSGGEKAHTVQSHKSGDQYNYMCDCGADVPFCSHICAVMMELEPERITRKNNKTKWTPEQRKRRKRWFAKQGRKRV